MRKTGMIFLCICLLTFYLTPSVTAYSGGDGTEENPYQIATLNDLKAVSDHLSAYYIQTADIDAGGEDSALVAGSFTGHYNGNGKKITLNTENAGFGFGIFKTIDAGGVVENLYTEGTVISGQNSLAPIAYSLLGTIRNCHNSANITSTQTHDTLPRGNVGGITAFIGKGAVIENCTNSGNLSAQDYVGGIVSGVNYSVTDYTIRNCSSTGNLTASKLFAGGIVGGVSGAVTGNLNITDCHSGGIIKGGTYAGGIVGGLNQTVTGALNITGCSSSADVEATTYYAGGIFGSVAKKQTDLTLNITKCYATGTVTSPNYLGGIAGGFGHVATTKTHAYVQGNYFTGTLSTENATARKGEIVGSPAQNKSFTGDFQFYIENNYSINPAPGATVGYNVFLKNGLAATNFIVSDSALNYATIVTAQQLKDPFFMAQKSKTFGNYFVYDIGDRTDKYPYPQFADHPHNARGTALIPVTVACGENGTVSKTGGYVTLGDTVSINVQPNDGYIISSVFCGEAPAVVQDANGFLYQTSPITSDTSIAVSFEAAPMQTPELISDVRWNYVPSDETGNITLGRIIGEETKIADYGIVYSAANAAPVLNGEACLTFSAKNYGGKSANGFFGVALIGSVLDNCLYYTRTYVTYTTPDDSRHTEYGAVITVDRRN